MIPTRPTVHDVEKIAFIRAGAIGNLLVSLPIVGMSTTEMAVTVVNDYTRYIHTDIEWLIRKMKKILDEPTKVIALNRRARETALKKFHIERFFDNWIETFMRVVKENKTLIV